MQRARKRAMSMKPAFVVRLSIGLLLFAGGLAFETSASAQYACAGPGPGRRMVGMHPGGNGIGATPLCVDDPSTAAPPPVAVEWVTSYLATAFHENASGGWMAAGQSSQALSERRALEACNEAMGGGCTLGSGGYNGAVVIARDSYGGLWSGYGASRGKAEKSIEAFCQKNDAHCEVIQWASSEAWTRPVGSGQWSSGEVYGPGDNPQRRYVSVAYADVPWKHPFGTKLWIQGGFPTGEASEAAVKAACERDSHVTCKVHRTIADGVLSVIETKDIDMRISSAPTARYVDRYMKESCKRDKIKGCKAVVQYDARLTQLVVHDVDPQKKAVLTSNTGATPQQAASPPPAQAPAPAPAPARRAAPEQPRAWVPPPPARRPAPAPQPRPDNAADAAAAAAAAAAVEPPR